MQLFYGFNETCDDVSVLSAMHNYETEKRSILSTFVSLGKMITLPSRPYNTAASTALESNGFYTPPGYIMHARIFVVNYSARTKACTVYSHSNTRIVSLIQIHGTDVCLRFMSYC